jgi:hypothetical protein
LKIQNIFSSFHFNCKALLQVNISKSTISQKDDKIKNSFAIRGYEMFKDNLIQSYKNYIQNEDYDKFINNFNSNIENVKKELHNGLIKKQNTTLSLPRFSQLKKNKPFKVDYTTILDSKKREELSQNFIKSFTNDKMLEQLNKQYKDYKETNLRKVYSKVDDFYLKEENRATHNKNVSMSKNNKNRP